MYENRNVTYVTTFTDHAYMCMQLQACDALGAAESAIIYCIYLLTYEIFTVGGGPIP